MGLKTPADDTPKEVHPVPEFLDWDLWIGPAPFRPFNDVYFPGPKWYRWWDFGNGTMSDLGSHRNDLPWWALKLDAPLTIEPLTGPKPHHDIAPASMSVKYSFLDPAETDILRLNTLGTKEPKNRRFGMTRRFPSGATVPFSSGTVA